MLSVAKALRQLIRLPCPGPGQLTANDYECTQWYDHMLVSKSKYNGIWFYQWAGWISEQNLLLDMRNFLSWNGMQEQHWISERMMKYCVDIIECTDPVYLLSMHASILFAFLMLFLLTSLWYGRENVVHVKLRRSHHCSTGRPQWGHNQDARTLGVISI